MRPGGPSGFGPARSRHGELPVPAPALRRIAAFCVDQTPVVVYLASLLALGWLLTEAGADAGLEAAFGDPLRAQLLGLVLLTFPVVMYFALWEGSAVGATPGKLLLNLGVVGPGGGHLSLERAVLRSALKVLPWEISHTVLWRLPGWPVSVETLSPGAVAGFAFAWVVAAVWLFGFLMQAEGRTGYDRLAGSTVVRRIGSSTPAGLRVRAAAGSRSPGKDRALFTASPSGPDGTGAEP